jgi:hypothetical protein
MLVGNKQMNNSEKRATLGTQDTVRRQTKQNTHQYTPANTNNVNKTWAQRVMCTKLDIYVLFMHLHNTHAESYLCIFS